jgi:N-acylglucosamine 2-epimerase
VNRSWPELRRYLLSHLREHVMPFWTNHALDEEHGGIFTFLSDDGRVNRRDKSVVSNARALWTFSALASRIEDLPEWRSAAGDICAFLLRHGRDELGRWHFLLDEEGAPLIGNRSIVADAFAIHGLVEYFNLSGDQRALEAARQTYESCRNRLENPGSYETVLYPTPEGMKPHREAMQFSLAFFELGRALQDPSILDQALVHSNAVLDRFYRHDRSVLLEYLGADGKPRNTPAGRTMVPGHAIESLWFQIHIRSSREIADSEAARRAAAAMVSCFERGWDPEFGGLYLGIDVEGKSPPYWKMAEIKRWWPHCEALCGSLLAYEQTGADWCREWYWRTHDWAFEHFPDWEHGEWIQNLDRAGRPLLEGGDASRDPRALSDLAERTGADKMWIEYDLRIKDPFHLPRALIVAVEALERLTAVEGEGG